ncbi:MAG: NAD-binding protein [Desulfovibrionales bacterium]
MRILVCGAGKITTELLRQLGDNWEITLIDRSDERIARVREVSPFITDSHTEDPSSSVALEQAGLKDQEYVLALTEDDRINLAVAESAREAGVPHVICLVHEQTNAPSFRKLGARTIMMNQIVSRHIHHDLQDPRMTITQLSGGEGSIYEVDASHHFKVVGKRASYFIQRGMRLTGIIRKGKLFFPTKNTVIKADDRLIITSRGQAMEPVCDLLEWGSPHFPLAYGQGFLLCMPWEEEVNGEALLNEGLYLSRNTKIRQVTILCQEGKDVSEYIENWPQELSCEISSTREKMAQRIIELTKNHRFGFVVIPPINTSFLKSLTGPSVTSLAHNLSCPLFIARNSAPYERILVPFNGKPSAERALEVGVDIARQTGAGLDIIVVEEPEFIKGETAEKWLDEVLTKVRELTHIHKVKPKELVCRGNPVREILNKAGEYDLLVTGSTEKERALISPNVAENLANKAESSVLLVTS